jgi:hypothetical protein
MLTFKNFLTGYLSIKFITLVKNKLETKLYKKCVKVSERNTEFYCSYGPKWPKAAHCGPAQRGLPHARGAYPRTRPQPGPGPGKWRPAWAVSGPRAPYLSVAVGSDPTAVRLVRPGQNPGPPRVPRKPSTAEVRRSSWASAVLSRGAGSSRW